MLKGLLHNTVSCNAEAGEPFAALGGLCFSAAGSGLPAGAGLTHAHVDMPCLDGQALWCEEFFGSGPVRQGQLGALRYRHTDEVIFGVLQLEEGGFPSQPHLSPLQSATRAAYEQVFAALKATGFPHVFRFWNYMADINACSHDLERYRQFNLGRQQAFQASGRELSGNVPAACALGTASGPLTVAFLAGRLGAIPVENPRQLSAYQYPPQYGPSSPLFSRASLASAGKSDFLFISGTASILGHTTLHPGDVGAQTRETVANLAAVVDEANRKLGRKRIELRHLDCRVYVRHPEHVDLVRQTLAACMDQPFKAAYVQADICRADLLLEIEATASLNG